MDMLKTVAPKSSQLNADDLIGNRSMTITVTEVIAGPSLDQPVSIHYVGGLPFLPCKSMRRVLVHCWGNDATKYIGKSMTLYRDDKVKFGGAEVGGIRISHMSDISEPMTMALTATRAQRKPYTVKPLEAANGSTQIDNPIDTAIALARITTSPEELEKIAKDAGKLKGWTPAKTEEMKQLMKQRRAEFKEQTETETREPGE